MAGSISLAHKRAVAAALAVLLALGPGGAAWAAPAKSSVVVLPFVPLPGASPPFAAKVSAQVSNELRQQGELKLVEAKLSARAGASPENLKADAAKARATATDLFNQAGDLSQKGKSKQAARLLQKAAALLSSQPLALDEAGGKLLSDVLLQLAVTRAMAGEDEGSDASLAELVRRAPEKTLAAGSFPPAFMRSFEAERQRTLSTTRATLRVLAPEGTAPVRVLLDGRPLGNAPLLLTEVLPGDHAVRIESGDSAWADAVKIAAGASSTLLPSFGGAGEDGPAAWLSKGSLDKATAAKLAKIARDANAKGIVVGAVSREGDGYTVRSALVLARGDKVVPLTTLTLDAEMLGASLEVLRLADDLVAKLSGAQLQAASVLPLSLGGSGSPAGETSAFTTVPAAPPAIESALSVPAAADLAAAAGTEKKKDDLPLPLPEGAAAAPLGAEPAPVVRAPVIPAAPPASEASVTDRTPVIPGTAPRAVVPVAPPTVAAAPIAPTPAAPAPVVPPPPAPAPIVPTPVATPVRDRFPVLAATPPLAPAPAAVPVPTSPAADRTPVIPGKPAAPETTPALAAKDSVSGDSAPLANAAPKTRSEEPAPSRDLFVPRRATVHDDDDQPAAVAPSSRAAPQAAVQMEAREANEVATVRDQPVKKHHTVLWIVAGALVVGAAGVAGVVLYENSRSASSSNVALSWTH